MAKILHKIKEILLNMVLVLLVFVMIMLMYLNWTKGLNIESMPEDFLGYEYIMSFFERETGTEYEIQGQNFVTPSKIAIKSEGKLHTVVYNDTESIMVYNELFGELYGVANNNIRIENSNITEFFDAIDSTEFAYIEFLCPLSAIINVQSEIFVGDMIVCQNEGNAQLFVKSNLDFYKITLVDTEANFVANETLSTDYTLEITSEGIINLVSDTSTSVYQANIQAPYIDVAVEQNIISVFLYNPAVVTNYETSFKEQIYVNEYSSISIFEDYIEFESNDPRGNIFNEKLDLSATQMIGFSIDIFNEIYSDINSSIVAHPSDFYYEDGQMVVIISGEFNGINVNLDEPFGIFVFSSSGLAYCKINLLAVDQADNRTSLVKTSILDLQNKLIISYDLEGNADWKYYFNKE